MGLGRWYYLKSIMDGHLPEKPLLFYPDGLSQKEIDEIRARKACINCKRFSLGNGNYLIGDGDCHRNGDYYGIVESVKEEKCDYFGRK